MNLEFVIFGNLIGGKGAAKSRIQGLQKLQRYEGAPGVQRSHLPKPQTQKLSLTPGTPETTLPSRQQPGNKPKA